MRDRSHLCDVVHTALVLALEHRLDNLLRPVRPVAQQAEVAQRLFRAAELALVLAEGVGELDEQLAVPVTLVLGQGEDTGDVVVLGGLLFFREITDEVAPGRVSLTLMVIWVKIGK